MGVCSVDCCFGPPQACPGSCLFICSCMAVCLSLSVLDWLFCFSVPRLFSSCQAPIAACADLSRCNTDLTMSNVWNHIGTPKHRGWSCGAFGCIGDKQTVDMSAITSWWASMQPAIAAAWTKCRQRKELNCGALKCKVVSNQLCLHFMGGTDARSQKHPCRSQTVY